MIKSKKDKLMNYILLLLVPAIGGVILLITRPEGEQTSVSDEVLPAAVPVEGNIKLDTSKIDAYGKAQEAARKMEFEQQYKLESEKDFFAMTEKPKADTGKKEQKTGMTDAELFEVATALKEANESEKESNVGSKATSGPVGSSSSTRFTSSVSTTSDASEATTEQAATVETPKKKKAGFGIVRSEESTIGANAGTENAKGNSSMPVFVPAVLEQDKQIKTGSNVMFILSQDATFQNKPYKKGSFLYGRAKLSSEFFDINIYQIKSAADGKLYPANLLVYDENYNRGVRTEGMLNELAKQEGVETAAQEIDRSTSSSNSSIAMLDAAINAATRTAQRAAQSKPVVISLKAGYKVNIVENNDKNK